MARHSQSHFVLRWLHVHAHEEVKEMRNGYNKHSYMAGRDSSATNSGGAKTTSSPSLIRWLRLITEEDREGTEISNNSNNKNKHTTQTNPPKQTTLANWPPQKCDIPQNIWRNWDSNLHRSHLHKSLRGDREQPQVLRLQQKPCS